jgi:hypothetical protein
MTTTFDFGDDIENSNLSVILEVIENPDTPISTLKTILEKAAAKNIIEPIKSKIEEAVHIAMQRKNSTDISTFDFKDGKGKVQAHRHINRTYIDAWDRWLEQKGGWVADTAYVEDSVYVGEYAKIFGYSQCSENASISDYSKIYDNAIVYGNAKISGCSRIYDYAEVSDYAVVEDSTICELALIYGDAIVTNNRYIKGTTQIYDASHHKLSNEPIFSWITELLTKGKSQGYLTYAEINEHLPNDIANPEDIEEIVNLINGAGISIYEFPPNFIQSISATTKTSTQQPTGFKIPPPPEPLQFNTQRISEIKTESKKVSAMLNAIYDQDEITPVTINTEQSAPQTTQSVLNLDAAHLELVKILATRHEWQRDELQTIMKGMMIDGVLEHINDAFFDYCDEAFIEGDDPIEINVELYEEIFK